jgi:chromosome segregation ATPase
LSTLHEQRLDSLKHDALENIHQLADELREKESTISALNDDISKLTNSLDKNNKDHQVRMAELESKHENHLKSLMTEQNQVVDQLESALREKELLLQRFQAEIQYQAAAMEDRATKHAETMAKTTMQHDHTLQQLQEQHDEKIQRLQSQLEQENSVTVNRLQAEHKNAIVRLELEHEKQLSMMSVEFRDHMQNMEKERATLVERQVKKDHGGALGVSQLQAKLAMIGSLHRQLIHREAHEMQRTTETVVTVPSSDDFAWESDDIEPEEIELSDGSGSHAPYDELVAAEYEARVAQLEAKLQEKDETIACLRDEIGSQMDELMTARGELEKARDDSALVEGLTSDIESLEMERTTLTEILCEKDMNIAELEAEILKLEIEKELLVDRKESNRVQQLEEKLRQDSQEHTAGISALEDEVQRRQVELVAKSATITAQAENLDSVENSTEHCSANHRQALADMRKELQKTKTALSDKDDESRERAHLLQVHHRQVMTAIQEETEHLRDLVNSQTQDAASKDQKIKALMDELASSRLSAEENIATFRRDLATARAELNKAKIALMHAEDDLRDVKCMDLPELEDELAQQKKEIHRLTELLIAKEADCRSAHELETVAGKRTRETQGLLNSLTQKNAELKRQLDRYELALEEKEQTIGTSAAKIADLRIDLRRLESDCSQLRSAKLTADDEREKLVVALERAIHRNDQLQALEVQSSKHAQELVSRDTYIASREKELTNLEAALKERTCLLNDMVTYNKDLECKVTDIDSRYADLTEQHARLQQQLVDRDQELFRLREESKELEHQYLENISSEQTRREMAEAEVESLSEKYQSTIRDNRNNTELEKENEALRDKVHRQEVYLKRRLEKDRAARDRSRANVTRAPGQTHSNSQSTRRVTRSRGLLPESTPVESQESIDRVESIDWELEALLAD